MARPARSSLFPEYSAGTAREWGLGEAPAGKPVGPATGLPLYRYLQ